MPFQVVVTYTEKKGVLKRSRTNHVIKTVKSLRELNDFLTNLRNAPNFGYLVGTGLLLPITEEQFFEFEKQYFNKSFSTKEDLKRTERDLDRYIEKYRYEETQRRWAEEALNNIRYLLRRVFRDAYDSLNVGKYGDVEIKLKRGLVLRPRREKDVVIVPTEGNVLYGDILKAKLSQRYICSVKEGGVHVELPGTVPQDHSRRIARNSSARPH